MSQRYVYNPRARWLRRLRHKRNTMSQDRREAMVRRWMLRYSRKYDSAFDLAVSCVYDLSLVSMEGVGGWPGDFEIPQYAINIAESIMESGPSGSGSD